MGLETCTNCKRLIGKYEQAYIVKGQIVCKKCEQLLRNVKQPSNAVMHSMPRSGVPRTDGRHPKAETPKWLITEKSGDKKVKINEGYEPLITKPVSVKLDSPVTTGIWLAIGFILAPIILALIVLLLYAILASLLANI